MTNGRIHIFFFFLEPPKLWEPSVWRSTSVSAQTPPQQLSVKWSPGEHPRGTSVQFASFLNSVMFVFLGGCHDPESGTGMLQLPSFLQPLIEHFEGTVPQSCSRQEQMLLINYSCGSKGPHGEAEWEVLEVLGARQPGEK